MRENLQVSAVRLEDAPIDTPGSIGLVERYHAPLCFDYTNICTTLSKNNAADAGRLRMSVLSVNATMRQGGPCPMLLLYGAIPSPSRKHASPTQLDRKQAIDTAKSAVISEQEKLRVSFALRNLVDLGGRRCQKGFEICHRGLTSSFTEPNRSVGRGRYFLSLCRTLPPLSSSTEGRDISVLPV